MTDDAERMAQARELVASWTEYEDDRWALGQLLEVLGLDDIEPREQDRYYPPDDPEIDWTCTTCKRLITLADPWVVHRTDDGTTVWHADCEPT